MQSPVQGYQYWLAYLYVPLGVHSEPLWAEDRCVGVWGDDIRTIAWGDAILEVFN